MMLPPKEKQQQTNKQTDQEVLLKKISSKQLGNYK